ncbi:TetR/AcrR family transcriptional regulator [Halarcobacter anaerophilus]|uniref:TetR/AcrR family transcriptional regulator n=1 Tax=Halarcobacter anaerophilus TaxID=877500 RepID=UPI0006972D5E|nr:TetR/AcrR family transcriptional regulator [Halarcobacter anaerophilus]
MTTKEQILHTATQEFSKLGYNAVSMNDLVKKLKLNKATIYYYFKDKKTLYEEVLKDALGKVSLDFDLSKDEGDGKILLKSYIDNLCFNIEKNPYLIALGLRELANYGANINENILPLISKQITYVDIIFSKLDLNSEFENINTYAFSSLIHGTIHNFYVIHMSKLALGTEELKQNDKKTLDYISNFLFQIIINAVCKEK